MQPFWEAKGPQLVKKFPVLYGTQGFITIFTNSPQPGPILSQINPVYNFLPHFFKIHFHIIHPSMPGSSKWSSYFIFPHQNHECTSFLLHTCHMHHSAPQSNYIWWVIPNLKHVIAFHLSSTHATCPTMLLNQITFGEVYTPWSSTLCTLLHSPVPSSLSGPTIYLRTLSPNTLSLQSSLDDRQNSRPIQNTHNYHSTYLIVMLLDRKWKDEEFWTEW